MRVRRNTLWIVAISPLLAVMACERGGEQLTAPPDVRAPGDVRQGITVAAALVSVANVEELYDAVNDPANEDAVIQLSPGNYLLSVNDPGGAARPNSGRLEFQRGMSLYGVTGDKGAVVIDASALPSSAFTVSFGRTAPIRIGRGNNTVEWLTIAGNTTAAASIATELTGTPTTTLRVAHVVAGGSSRGIDIRNVGATMVGRRIEAEVIDSEFDGPTEVVGLTEGIRVSNFVGAHNGVIIVKSSGNRASGYQLGCIVANNRSSNASVTVRSSGDRFFGNTAGCEVAGGLSQTTGVANNNVVTFESHGSQFVRNNAGIPGIEPGGLRVSGGVATVAANATSNNVATVELWGSKVEENDVVDLDVFGAWKASAPGIAGTGNQAIVKLHGVSKRIDVTAVASFPAEPAGTNTVTVIR